MLSTRAVKSVIVLASLAIAWPSSGLAASPTGSSGRATAVSNERRFAPAGANRVPVLSIAHRVGDAPFEHFRSLRLRFNGTNPSDVRRVLLFRDRGRPGFNRQDRLLWVEPLAGRGISLNPTDVPLASGSMFRLIVAVDLDPGAVTGHEVDFRLPAGGLLLRSGPVPNEALNPGGALMIDRAPRVRDVEVSGEGVLVFALRSRDGDGPPATFGRFGGGPDHGDLDLLGRRCRDGGRTCRQWVAYSPDPGFTGADGFPFAARDGLGRWSKPGMVEIDVNGPGTPANQPPTGPSLAGNTVAENEPSGTPVGSLSASDPDGDALTFSLVPGAGSADNGSFQIVGAQLRTAAPLDHEADATRDIRVGVSDGKGGQAEASFTITVTDANDAPIANDDTSSVDEDTVLNVVAPGVLANDTDDEGDPLTVTELNGSTPLTGTSTEGADVTINPNGSFSYDPTGSSSLQALAAGQQVGDTFTYTVEDSSGASDEGTATITVTGVNDAPGVTLDGGTLAYTENDPAAPISPNATVADVDDANLESASIQITGNFSSGQDVLAFVNTASITGSFNAGTGTLTLTGTATVADYQAALRSVTYRNTSDGPSTATRTVTFQVSDGTDTSSAQTRDITVSAVNDPPTAVDDASSTDEDTVLNVVAPGVLANDTDPDAGDTKTVSKVEGSAANVGTAITTAKGATVTQNANGSYSYDPTGSATLQGLSTGDQTTDTWTYRMQDGASAESNLATVTITVDGVSDAPTAGADSYDGVGNTTLHVGESKPAGQPGKELSGDVLDNDTDPDTAASSLTAVPETVATTRGGSATIDSDGSFSYRPAAGDTGVTDTFTYTVTDGVATDSGTVSIDLVGRVWYVRNNAAAGGLGRSHDPFDTLSEAATASGSGDTVYVFDGDNTNTGMNAGFAMNTNERLLSEIADLVIGADLLHTGTPANRPTIGNAAGAGVTLASGAHVQGFNVSGAGAAAISAPAATNGGTIADNTLTGNGGGLALPSTTGTFDVSSLTVNTTGGTGLSASGTSTVNLATPGTISITSSGGKGIDLSGNALSGTVDQVTVTSSGAGGVSLQNTTGSITFDAVDLTTTGGTGFFANNAAGLTINPAGTANVSSTGGTAVDLRSMTSPSAQFDSVTSTNSSGAGIHLQSIGGTFSATSGSISGASGAAVDVNGGGGTVTYPGNVGNGPGRPASIQNRSGGSVTLSGTITEADTGILLQNNTGGSTTFSGGSKTLNTGANGAVVASNNGGHTVTFSGGGLDIDTTTGKGLAATGGGTLSVTGSGNTIDTGAGIGLEVQNTTIGASDLTFQRISSNGASNGILLNATGSSGGLTVAGTGTAASGGLIQNATGDGVSLTSTRDVSLARMTITGADGNGIGGSSVTNLTLSNLQVTNNTDALTEAGIKLTNLSGTNTITDTEVAGSTEDNVQITNSSGTGTVTISGTMSGTGAGTTSTCLVRDNSTASGNIGINLQATGSGHLNATVDACKLHGNRTVAIRADTGDTSTMDATIQNNVIVAGSPNQGNQGIEVSSATSADITFDVTNNKVGTPDGVIDAHLINTGINVSSGGADPSAIGTVTGNTVVGPGATASGFGIRFFITDSDMTQVTSSVGRARIENNVVTNLGVDYGILVEGSSPSGSTAIPVVDASVSNNTVSAAPAGGLDAMRIQIRRNGNGCLKIQGNTAGAGGTGFMGLFARQADTATYRVEGLALGAQSAATTESYLESQNPGTSATDVGTTAATSFTGVAPGTCTIPT